VMRPDLYDAPDAPAQHTSTSGVAASPSSIGSGQRLPAAVQARMEHAFAADFSGVRVHPESTRPASIGALAYARGNDIYFSPGHYDPGSTRGLELIGHELTHTIQQRAGRVAVQGKGGGIESDPRLEAEADEMGARAARGEAVQMSAPPSPRAGAAAVPHSVIQRKEVATNFGTFKTTRFRKIEDGVDIVLEFHPDSKKVKAEKIGLTQAVRTLHFDGTRTGIDPTAEQRRTQEGWFIDQFPDQPSPIYLGG